MSQPQVYVEGVDRPAHYGNSTEIADFIYSHNLNFNLGSAVKYICRWDAKGDPIKDLQKAIWYLSYEMAQIANDPRHHSAFYDEDYEAEWRSFAIRQKLPETLIIAIKNIGLYKQRRQIQYLTWAIDSVSVFANSLAEEINDLLDQTRRTEEK